MIDIVRESSYTCTAAELHLLGTFTLVLMSISCMSMSIFIDVAVFISQSERAVSPSSLALTLLFTVAAREDSAPSYCVASSVMYKKVAPAKHSRKSSGAGKILCQTQRRTVCGDTDAACSGHTSIMRTCLPRLLVLSLRPLPSTRAYRRSYHEPRGAQRGEGRPRSSFTT